MEIYKFRKDFHRVTTLSSYLVINNVLLRTVNNPNNAQLDWNNSSTKDINSIGTCQKSF